MNHHIRIIAAIALAVSLLSSMVVRAQTLNPSYLSEMPPPAKILSEIKGKDAQDTIERQMGAFMALNKLIDDMAWGLEHRFLPNKIKPDELRIKDMYFHAYADLWHKAVNKELHKYDNDWDLLGELLNKFFSQSFRDLYSKSNANKEARLEAHRQRSSGVVFGVAPSASQPNAECAAKGLDDLTCKMQTALKGMIKTMGLTEEAEVDAATPGLVLSGGYSAPNFRVLMFPTFGSWVFCGDVWLQTTYAIEQKGNQIFVNIENGRDTLALTLQPDIKTLTGSGQTVSIHGYAPGGTSAATAGTPGSTNQTTTTRQRELTPLEAKQYPNAVKNGQTYTLNETTTSTEYTMPVSPGPAPWHPKSAPCRVGVLKYQIDNSNQDVPALVKDWFDEVPGLVQGLRMIGNYDGPGGASIKFFPEKAIVGCNATIVEHNYGVLVTEGKVFVEIFGHGGAEKFALRPDGILSGTGATVTRYGKRKTGNTYVQSSDSCTYGNLSPRGRAQTSVPARNATAPVVKNPPVATSTTNALEPPVLTVNNGFISQPANPLSGRQLLVLKVSFEEALRKAGFQDPASTPVKRSAVAIWAAACKAQSPMCKQGIDALQAFYVGTIRLDGAGTARVSGLPKGSFWVLGLGAANGQHFVWDLPIEIKPGANSVAFDARNATIIY